MQSPNVSDGKVLKILARKERRQQQASPAINLADILATVSTKKYGSTHSVGGERISGSASQEKASYLAKMKEENEVLQDLLHVRSLKNQNVLISMISDSILADRKYK